MFFFILIVLQSLAAPAAPSRTLSVCEVLTGDPTKLNGQVISVRGLLDGSDEGLWLYANPKCKTHLVIRGVTWGNILWVPRGNEDENAARAWRRFSHKLDRLHADLVRDRVSVTIVGRIETRESLDDSVVQMPYGWAKCGFGHLGSSLAEINVISLEDVTVERPSPDAGHTPKK